MTVTKTRILATITATIVIATVATLTGFQSVIPALATPVTLGTTEQFGNDTAADVTITSPTIGQGHQAIYITKDSTNSYVIFGSSSNVGSFDTTYRIVGERSAVRASEELIITTITDDFRTSSTIGYVTVGNTTTGTAQDTATLPNPFATPEQITERITSELRRVISEAYNNTPQGQLVEINCDFGTTLDDMHCHYIPLIGGAGGSAATTDTNNTDTTGAAASISP